MRLSDRDTHEKKLLAKIIRSEPEDVEQIAGTGLKAEHFSDLVRGAMYKNLITAFRESPRAPIEYFRNGIEKETLSAFDEDETTARNKLMRYIADLLDPDIDVNFNALTYAKLLIGSADNTNGEAKSKKKKKQGSAITFNDPEPHNEKVDGNGLFDEVYETIGRFIKCGEPEKIAITLFVFHAHSFDVSECTPILGVTSPVKRCGKSTLLSLLKELTPRAVSTSNVSAAVLFRVIEATSPTIIIDEADTFAKDKIELRGVINAGHSRSDAHVLRCDGDDYEPRAFNVFCPKVMAMIGSLRDLSDTVQDRAIEIKLQRIGAGESVEKFRRKQREGLRVIHSKLRRWSNDNIEDLKKIEPEVPDWLNDRAADGWEPLFAIVKLLGGEIPTLAHEAAKYLSGEEEVNSTSTELLEDIKQIFDEDEREVIQTSDILDKLNAMEESPWAGFHKGKGLSGRSLSKQLKPFGIKSHLLRIAGTPGRGYRREDFADAFARYLPPSASVTSVTSNKNNNLQPLQSEFFK